MCEGSGLPGPKDDPHHVNCPTLQIPTAKDAREFEDAWVREDEQRKRRRRLMDSLLASSHPSGRACIHDALLRPAATAGQRAAGSDQPLMQTCQNASPPHGDYDMRWSTYDVVEDESRLHSNIQDVGGFELFDATLRLLGLNKKGEEACPGRRVLAVCFALLAVFEVRACTARECEQRRIVAQQKAPPCQWSPFRELITTAVACWTPTFLALLISGVFEHMQPSRMHYFKKKNMQATRTVCLDLHGVLDLLRWAYRVVFEYKGLDHAILDIRDGFGTALMTIRPGFEYRVSYFNRRLEAYDLCPRRLWNMASLCQSSGWTESDAIHIILLMMESPPVPLACERRRHALCTAGSCVRANENTATMQQAHRCESRDCQNVVSFPLELLDNAYLDYNRLSQEDRWRQTAWSIDSLGSLAPSDAPYMALSHVWSDGTGVGLRSAGEVNQCLFEYFANFARALGCVGIWWDVIGLPISRKQRTAALNMMLENYSRAAVTVIHDQALATLDWSDDGRPAIALVLSDWFTRGWTAAELFASRGHAVKVIFRDPISGGPVLKDLDSDLLAVACVGEYGVWDQTSSDRALTTNRMVARRVHLQNDWEKVPKLGHIIASDIVRQLRDVPKGSGHSFGRVSTLRGLRGLLGSRTTSWPKDMMIIAGLLSSRLPLEFDSALSALEITRIILRSFYSIERAELLHSECTMTLHGPWSWCPSSLFDLGKYVTMSEHPRTSQIASTRAYIRGNGTLFCNWKAQPLHKDDDIYPASAHPSIVNEVSVASSHWWSCLLLGLEENSRDFVLALRVPRPQHDESPANYVFCKWIGCVRLGGSLQDIERQTVSIGVVFGSEEESTCSSSLHYADARPVFMDPVFNNATNREVTINGRTLVETLESQREELDTSLEFLSIPVQEQLPRLEPTGIMKAASIARASIKKTAEWISKPGRGIRSQFDKRIEPTRAGNADS